MDCLSLLVELPATAGVLADLVLAGAEIYNLSRGCDGCGEGCGYGFGNGNGRGDGYSVSSTGYSDGRGNGDGLGCGCWFDGWLEKFKWTV